MFRQVPILLPNFPHMAWVNPWLMVFRHLPRVPLYSVVVNIMKFYRHDREKYPVSEPNDERLDFLERMDTSLKLMDTAKRGQRIRGDTGDTANAWHVTLNGLADLVKSLLALGLKYICIGKMQSDRLEGEFGVIRQLSGGNYWISVEQIISSLTSRRMKLYHKLKLETVDSVGQVECCKQSLDDRDGDIELVYTCFSKASDLTESQRASLYYICGYVTFKEDINSSECDIYDVVESEFTNMVSRGRRSIHHRNCLICHSTYSFWKIGKKCCSRVFVEAFK